MTRAKWAYGEPRQLGCGETRVVGSLDGLRAGEGAFTLTELIISMAIWSLIAAAMINGYVMAAKRAEWSAYSFAAQSLALQAEEQCRAAKWDPQAYPAVDELVATNFPVRVEILDIPISGTNVVYATNHTTIRTVSVTPLLKSIRVDCVWMFLTRGPFTNTIVTYRAPDV